MVEAALKEKLDSFQTMKNDYSRLYELVDILCAIESTKGNPQYAALLGYFDSSSGVTPIVNKLPYAMQEKWTYRAAKYKKDHCVTYPPFEFFISFVREICETKNDPGLIFDSQRRDKKPKETVYARKHEIDIATQTSETDIKTLDSPRKRCPTPYPRATGSRVPLENDETRCPSRPSRP